MRHVHLTDMKKIYYNYLYENKIKFSAEANVAINNHLTLFLFSSHI